MSKMGPIAFMQQLGPFKSAQITPRVGLVDNGMGLRIYSYVSGSEFELSTIMVPILLSPDFKCTP